MIDFKGSHYPKDIILYAVSYRDLEEIMAERGVEVDHVTLNRWVVKFSPLIACEAQRRKSATIHSRRDFRNIILFNRHVVDGGADDCIPTDRALFT